MFVFSLDWYQILYVFNQMNPNVKTKRMFKIKQGNVQTSKAKISCGDADRNVIDCVFWSANGSHNVETV